MLIPGATQEQCKKFDQYLSLLLKWNKVYSLTAITDPDDVVNKHFLESLQLLPHLGSASTLLDLGTGPGFPGLPLAIMRPSLSVTLLDSIGKKVNFCREVARACALDNVNVVCGRAENSEIVEKIGRKDVIVSRATWDLKDYLPIALRYSVPSKSRIIALKGPKYKAELAFTDLVALGLGPPAVLPLFTGGEVCSDLIVMIFRA